MIIGKQKSIEPYLNQQQIAQLLLQIFQIKYRTLPIKITNVKDCFTLRGISTLPRRSQVVFPADAFKVSLINFRRPRESLMSPTFLNFSFTFSSGLKSQTSTLKLSCSTLFTSLQQQIEYKFMHINMVTVVKFLSGADEIQQIFAFR